MQLHAICSSLQQKCCLMAIHISSAYFYMMLHKDLKEFILIHKWSQIWLRNTTFSQFCYKIYIFHTWLTSVEISADCTKWPPSCSHFQMHFLGWKVFSFKNVIELSSVGSIDNMSALVQIMAGCRIGNKPLSDPMMTQFTDVYISVRNSVCRSHRSPA